MTTFQPSSRRPRRHLVALALAGALLVALGPVSAQGATRYTLDVSERGDFVAQTNFVQCVGASMQMMLNMIEPGRDRSARRGSSSSRTSRAPGAGRGPTAASARAPASAGGQPASNILGAGPYRLVGTKTLAQAMQTAAEAIKATGRPVGLLVWRGRHAWVMSGFEATADPGTTDEFRVTRAMVHDPLYPHGNAVWGRSPRPGRGDHGQRARASVRAAPDAQPARRPDDHARRQVRPGAAVQDRSPGLVRRTLGHAREAYARGAARTPPRFREERHAVVREIAARAHRAVRRRGRALSATPSAGRCSGIRRCSSAATS